MDRIEVWTVIFQIASAIAALFAAIFWFLSAAKPLPPMLTYWDSTPAGDPFYQALVQGVALNRIAAACAGASALSAGPATLLQLYAHK